MKFLTTIQVLTANLLVNTPVVNGDEPDPQVAKITSLIQQWTSIILGILSAVAIGIISVNLIKNAILLANSDTANQQAVAQAPKNIKHCVIAIIIIVAAVGGIVGSLYTWLQPLIANALGGFGG